MVWMVTKWLSNTLLMDNKPTGINRKPQTIAVKLKPAAERQVKLGHPWIYNDSIVKESKNPTTGDIAIVFDQKKNKYLAMGLYDMDSNIRIKILQAHKPAKINDAWINEHLAKAINLRKTLLSSDTNAYRIINGENDGFPGIIIDKYGDYIVLKLYTLMWMPWWEALLQAIDKNIRPAAIVLRASRNIEQQLKTAFQLQNGEVVAGNLPHPEVIFQEYGVKFKTNLIAGHKTGHFLDHRENRHRVGQLSAGKSVLDIFSYTGGFSIHALAGGARAVTSVDISGPALEVAQANAKLNRWEDRHHTIKQDAFEAMEDLVKAGKKFDIVVVDPPSFAHSQSQIPQALTSYKRLATWAPRLVADGGILVMASCSSRVDAELFFNTIEEAFGRPFQVIDKTYHAIDHPVTFSEGAYLKCGYYKF